MSVKLSVPPDPDGRVIYFRTSLRNTILDVMLGRGWQELDETSVILTILICLSYITPPLIPNLIIPLDVKIGT